MKTEYLDECTSGHPSDHSSAQIMKRDGTLQKVFSDSLESVSGDQVKYSREDKKEDR